MVEAWEKHREVIERYMGGNTVQTEALNAALNEAFRLADASEAAAEAERARCTRVAVAARDDLARHNEHCSDCCGFPAALLHGVVHAITAGKEPPEDPT